MPCVKYLVFGFLAFSVSCKPRSFNAESDLEAARKAPQFPQISASSELLGTVYAAVNKNRELDPAFADNAAIRISNYLAFLGAEANSFQAKNTLSRVLNGSTQFLFCTNFEDWTCLEDDPVIEPSGLYRKAIEKKLGKRIDVREPFQAEFFFTNGFYTTPPDFVDPTPGTVADRLAEKIMAHGSTSMSMALYGIDDIEASMRSVFASIVSQKKQGSKIRAVVDVKDINKTSAKQGQLEFSAFNPLSVFSFQYKETATLMEILNSGLSGNTNAIARPEFPTGDIMHNKFFVFESKEGLSMWSGTANVSKTCMGTERNSNVAIYVKNKAIADVFLDQFNQMYELRETPFTDKKFSGTGTKEFLAGRFHKNKVPRAKRYFRFSDGTEVKVHFSPTDDTEHRSILPMIHSAKSGDVLRISMFGGAGLEYVRAMQWAVARGVDVRVVLDGALGFSQGSWAVDKFASLAMPNPYAANPKGKLTLKFDRWKGLNHHKSSTLTRASGKVEVMVIGSQNWSQSGNDDNDENTLTIRNRLRDVPGGVEFNKHYDDEVMANAGEKLPPAEGEAGEPVEE